MVVLIDVRLGQLIKLKQFGGSPRQYTQAIRVKVNCIKL